MTPSAVTLAKSLILRISRTFTLKFLLSPDPDLSVPGLDQYTFDDRSLLTGRSLSVAKAKLRYAEIV